MSFLHLGWFSGSITLTKNKSLEYQWGRKLAIDPFQLTFRWTNKGDHAGFRFWFSIFRLFFYELSITDNRHWNYEEGRFYYPDEEDRMTKEWAKLDEELGPTLEPGIERMINARGDTKMGRLN
jgi:hypothetical protein